MKQIIVAIVVVLAAVAAFKYYDRYRTGDTNRGRVVGMVRAMGEKDEQTALCLWALNKEVADRDTMNAYYDRYLKFVSVSGLDGSSGWAVAEAKASDDRRATMVTVKGNDRSLVMRVAEGVPIELQQ